jgi:nucleotide-binding universal stress UspA family protein
VSAGTLAPVSCPPDLVGGFGGPGGRDIWEAHQQFLRMMDEPILACGVSDADETYRLIWVHSFTVRSPLVVRVSRRGRRVLLRAARFAWSTESGQLRLRTVSDIRRGLTGDDWSSLLQQAKEHEFWGLSGPLTVRGEDGSTWLLEGRRGNAYHSAARHSPDDEPFRRFAIALVLLGQFNDPEPRAR